MCEDDIVGVDHGEGSMMRLFARGPVIAAVITMHPKLCPIRWQRACGA